MPEINAADAELEALMAQLEMETGVAVAPSPAAPAVAKSTVAVAPTDEEALLAELEGAPTAPVTLASVAPILEAAGKAAVAADLSVEDELALLEAAAQEAPVVKAAINVKPEVVAPVLEVVQQVSDNEGRGESFIPGVGVIHDPAKDPAPEVKPEVKAAEPTPGPKMASDVKIFTDPKTFVLDTAVSDNDLDRCFIEQNSLFATYGTRAAQAANQHGRLKLKFEVTEAMLYEEHRRLAAEEGEKVTEKALEGRVKTDKRWAAAKLKVIDAEAVADIERALVESLKHRKDMLVQMGADRRGELQGQARTMIGQGHAAQQRDYAQNLLKEQMGN